MKNKLIILSISLVTISNCTIPPSRPEPVQKYVCNCKESMELKSFIQNSIKNANNMSDEEMEDVIEQLEETTEIEFNDALKTLVHGKD